MTAAPPPLPRWDLSVVYPALDSPEFASGLPDVKRQVASFVDRFDRRGVRKGGGAVVDAVVFGEVTDGLNAALEAMETLRTHVDAFVVTDSRKRMAQAVLSELDATLVSLRQLGTRYVAWVGDIDLHELLARSRVSRQHEFPLWMAQGDATNQMIPAEEALAAELEPAAGTAWERLHVVLTSRIEVDVEIDGTLGPCR